MHTGTSAASALIAAWISVFLKGSTRSPLEVVPSANMARLKPSRNKPGHLIDLGLHAEPVSPFHEDAASQLRQEAHKGLLADFNRGNKRHGRRAGQSENVDVRYVVRDKEQGSFGKERLGKIQRRHPHIQALQEPARHGRVILK